MAHFPVDHPLRGLYRGLALLTGAALVGYGVVGFLQTSSRDFFDQSGERVLGLTTNPAFAILSIVLGVAVIAATAIGRNLDAAANTLLGGLFWVLSLAMLCVIRSDFNYLASSVTNVVIWMIVGTVLVMAGLYGGVSRPGFHKTDIGSRAKEAASR